MSGLAPALIAVALFAILSLAVRGTVVPTAPRRRSARQQLADSAHADPSLVGPNKAAHLAVGIDTEGRKQVLGI